ncbi:MAG: GYD domain-containing protein [Bryobacteraceae bacterium]
MPSYLFQVSYSAEAWAAMIKRPQDRVEAVRKAVEKLGGKVGAFWLAFGDYDLVGILDMPDNVNAAAFSFAVAAGGACKNVKTTPLLSIAEGLAAMKKAGKSAYKPVTRK